jgi:hypothetical protein
LFIELIDMNNYSLEKLRLFSCFIFFYWVCNLCNNGITQVSFTENYQQNFNGLASSNACGTNSVWNDNTTLAGWYAITPRFRSCDGSQSAGGLYNFGKNANSDRALGSIGSGGNTVHFGLRLKNTTAAPISTLIIRFRGEQWRRGDGAPNDLKFAFQLTSAFSGLTSGVWVSRPKLTFTAPLSAGANVAVDGTLHTKVLIDTLSGINFAPGQELILRWTDTDDGSNDDGLAIDDLEVLACPLAPPPSSAPSHFQATPISWNAAQLQWNAGSGQKTLVVACEGAPCADFPRNQVGYRGAAQFRAGDPLGTNQFVVYNGTQNAITVTHLKPNTAYYFVAFSVNGEACNENVFTQQYAVAHIVTPPSPAPSASDTITVMHYNLLWFPRDDAQERLPHFRRIFQYARPTIVVVNELTSEAGADTLLKRCFNINGKTSWKYARFTRSHPYIQENMLFYDSQKFTLALDTFIVTHPFGGMRDIDHYKLFYKNVCQNDSIGFYLFQAHLKAGSPAEYPGTDLTRLIEAQQLRKVIDNLPAGTPIIFSGDLNLYSSNEPAFQELLGGPNPLKMPTGALGDWSGNPAFSCYHTQSTRKTNNDFGIPVLAPSGVTGSLDDWFDHFLVTEPILNGSQRITYVPGSFQALGNNCNLLNKSILETTSVPDSVRIALYMASDHLPILMKLKFDFIPCSKPSAPRLWVGNGNKTLQNGDTLDLGTVYLGCNALQTLTLKNIGDAPLVISGAGFLPPNAAWSFAQPISFPTNLPASSSDSLTVTIEYTAGNEPGVAIGTLQFNHNVGSPFTLYFKVHVANFTSGFCARDLFISQYIELGSSSKYIELYNGTPNPIDLSDYRLMVFYNGRDLNSIRSQDNILLSGVLPPGQTFVVGNRDAPYRGTQLRSTALDFNGNDAIGLYNHRTQNMVDIFGVIGVDPEPGTNPQIGWLGSCGNKTADINLARKITVVQGVGVNPSGGGNAGFATLCSEWEFLSTANDSIGLGRHSMLCNPIAAANNGPLCEGQSLRLWITGLPPEATVSWRGPGGFTAAAAETTLANVRINQAGVYTATVKLGNCALMHFTTEVSIGSRSVAVTSNAPLCQGGTLKLTANGAPGARYQWQGPNGFISTLASPQIPNALSTQSGVYILTQISGVCTALATIMAQVFTTPTLSVVSKMDAVCGAGSVAAMASPSANYTYQLRPSGQTNTTGIFTDLLPGVYLVSATIGACSTSLPIQIAAAAGPTITSVNGLPNGLQIRWTPVPGATAYTIRYRIAGTTDPWQLTTAQGEDGIEIQNLRANATYEFQVQAICSNGGRSAFSSSEFGRTSDAPCNAPSTLTHRFNPDRTLTLTWNMVPGAVCYILTYGPTANPQAWVTKVIPANSVNYTISSYASDLSYTFIIRANCSLCSSASGVISPNATRYVVAPATRKALSLLDNQGGAGNFRVYPNPTKGLVYVQNLAFSQDQPEETIDWELIDLQGKTLESGSHVVSSEPFTINIEKYSIGVYFLKIRTQNDFFVSKIQLY